MFFFLSIYISTHMLIYIHEYLSTQGNTPMRTVMDVPDDTAYQTRAFAFNQLPGRHLMGIRERRKMPALLLPTNALIAGFALFAIGLFIGITIPPVALEFQLPPKRTALCRFPSKELNS
jgi:hypothetical protein